MPFQEIYRVDFSRRDLTPTVNVINWPGMVELSEPAGTSTAVWDDEGLNLTIARQVGAPPVRHSVYVDLVDRVTEVDGVLVPHLAPGLPLNVRLLARVEFDLPTAHGFPLDTPGDGEGNPPEAIARETIPGSPGHHDPAGKPFPSPWVYSIPEPWAVGLNVSLDPNVSTTPHEVNVTCQFNTAPSGVRLNTTSGVESDQAHVLEGPLDYHRYQRDGMDPPRLFFLEQSFCGWGADANRQGPGNGVLRITRGFYQHLFPDEIVEDQRVFTHKILTSQPGWPVKLPTIRALGISLITLQGHGRMSVRLRSFSVWMNGTPYPTMAPE